MSKTSRTVIRILLLLLVFAGIFPFVYPMKDGKPLLSLDKLKLPKVPNISLPKVSLPSSSDKTTAKPVTIYKWRDSSGNLHFSSSKPPSGILYETNEVDPNTNMIQGSVGAPATPGTENGASTASNNQTDKEVVFGYTPEKINEMLEKARNVKKAVELRQQVEKESIQ